LVFFVDRSLGEIDVPQALRAAGAVVAVHSDYFADDAPDTHWLRVAGHQGWVVLTKDHGIRKRHVERQAIIQGRVKAFFLVPRKVTGAVQGQLFVRALRKMWRLAAGHPAPFIGFVYSNGVAKIVERPRG
jgi:predicted nuclease of predicted toxin-antitoxin system